MEIERAHEMSGNEVEEWATARLAVRAALGDAGEKRERRKAAMAALGRRPSAEKLGRALLLAVQQKDAEVALEVLSQGANPNLRDQGLTPLDIALRNNMEEVSIAVVGAGGWSGPERYSEESKKFTAAAAKNEFVGALAESSKKKTMREVELYAQSWGGVAAARDACDPARSDASLMQAQCAMWHFGQVEGGLKVGVEMDEACWSGMCGPWIRVWGEPRLLRSAANVESLRAMLVDPAKTRTMPARVAESLFVNAVIGDDALTLLALLDGGLRPSPDWTIPMTHNDKARATMLVAAACVKGREVYDILREFPVARRCALGMSERPAAMARVPVARLLELGAMGVELEQVDAEGRGVAHHWALMDEKPRDGWASLATRAPAVFGALDAQGKTGAQRMGEKLNGKARDDFLGSLSRIESREIRKEVGAPPKPAPASAPKRRL